jgi:hypothetical protein
MFNSTIRQTVATLRGKACAGKTFRMTAFCEAQSFGSGALCQGGNGSRHLENGAVLRPDSPDCDPSLTWPWTIISGVLSLGKGRSKLTLDLARTRRIGECPASASQKKTSGSE